MTENELELLVILDEQRAELTLELLRACFTVSQVASRRIVILQAPAGQTESITALDGVQAVISGEVPEALLTGLEPTEKLFVQAWDIRQGSVDKFHPGEGLAWDAEGFEAPDLPQE